MRETDISARGISVADARAAATPIPVYVVLYDGVLLLDLAGIAEPYRIANRWARDNDRPEPFALRFIAEREQVTCSLRLSITRDAPLPERVPDKAWLIVPGGIESVERLDLPSTRRLVAWLRAVATQPAKRITVCSGALLAGMAGWLDGLACTTHHDLIAALRRVAPNAKVVENRIFVDIGIATSAGITAGIDLALWTIGRKCDIGLPLGAKFRGGGGIKLLFARRVGDDPQISPWLMHRNHLHPAVHRAQDAVARAPARAWTQHSIAAAHVGERHLNRLFLAQTGVTPRDYVQQLRLALARSLLAEPRCTVERAAAVAGFSSANHLRRAWRRTCGEAPRRAAA